MKLLFFSPVFISLVLPAESSLLSNAPDVFVRKDDPWLRGAISAMWRERADMGHTPVIPFRHPSLSDTIILFKDESTTKTKSLKHRFVWALFMWALVNGYIKKQTVVFDSSSGNTAVSEAYFARLIGVQYVAVVGSDTSTQKLVRIESYGAQILITDPSQRIAEAKASVALNPRLHFFIDQFRNADKAEEYFESGSYPLEGVNVFREILVQISQFSSLTKQTRIPDYFVQSAGTGGTISSVGRYVRKYGLNTTIVFGDTQYSGYYDWILHGKFGENDTTAPSNWVKPGISGVGYGYDGSFIQGRTTSLLPAIVDVAVKVPDLLSIAAMNVLRNRTGIVAGPSTGLNFATALHVAANSKRRGSPLAPIVISTLICDHGSAYFDTYYNSTWIAGQFVARGGVDKLLCLEKVVEQALQQGRDPLRSYDECDR